MRRRRTLRTSSRSSVVARPVEDVWAVVASGRSGSQWYVDAAPFRFRGALDRLLGGHQPADPPGRDLLVPGDRAGFWEVLDVEPADHRLVLEARVRAPGRVRLTAIVVPGTDGTELSLTVAFDPSGVIGTAYLLADLPAREAVVELALLHLLTELRRP